MQRSHFYSKVEGLVRHYYEESPLQVLSNALCIVFQNSYFNYNSERPLLKMLKHCLNYPDFTVWTTEQLP